MSDFTDRLLDAGLKEYSRAMPPMDLAARVAAAGSSRPRPRFAWGWTLAPVASAAAVAIILSMRPAPAGPPAVAILHQPAIPAKPGVIAQTKIKHLKTVKPAVHYRTLTAVEIARLDVSALLAPMNELKPIGELVVEPLESANPNTETKE